MFVSQQIDENMEIEKIAPPVYERFVAYQTTLVSTGIQSRIALGEIDGTPVIKKTAGSELSRESLYSLASVIPEYRASLTRAGLIIPKNFSVRVNDGLELIDEYVEGRDLDVMVRMADPEAQEVWIEMVSQLCNANEGANRSAAMIDAKPANFIRSGNTLYYIDLFPPMLRDADGMITPWIPEVFKRDRRMMSFNFGDTRGQITKLLAGSRLAYREMFEYLKEWTLQAMEGNLPSQTIDYIKEQVDESFPDMNLFYSGKDISQRMEELSK